MFRDTRPVFEHRVMSSGFSLLVKVLHPSEVGWPWGLMAGVFDSIPYFGPVVVTGGMAVVAFLQFGTIEMAATVAVMALVITTLEGFLLIPWLTSRAARMNAVAVFVGLIFWGWVWEVWGLLLPCRCS